MPSAKLITELVESGEAGALHHAYTLIGAPGEVLERLFTTLEKVSAGTLAGNPDFYSARHDVFGINESRELSTRAANKSFAGGKRFYIISAESFTIEAQNALLKLFEEPTAGTHFFIIIPQVERLLATLRSRVVIINVEGGEKESDLAQKFITASPATRLKLIAPLTEDEVDPQLARNFFTGLEKALHQRIQNNFTDKSLIAASKELSRVQKYWNDPAAARRLLLEHLALALPKF